MCWFGRLTLYHLVLSLLFLSVTYVLYSYTCLDEGEDFYRLSFSVSSPEELADMKIECSYGVSDFAPEDAILQVMMGKALEEHPLLTLNFMPEKGKTYDLKLVPDGEGTWKPVPFEAE